MSFPTELMLTEAADDIPRETASPAWGCGLLRMHSPCGTVFYWQEINLFILTEKGLNLFYYSGLRLNSFSFNCLGGDC